MEKKAEAQSYSVSRVSFEKPKCFGRNQCSNSQQSTIFGLRVKSKSKEEKNGLGKESSIFVQDHEILGKLSTFEELMNSKDELESVNDDSRCETERSSVIASHQELGMSVSRIMGYTPSEVMEQAH